MEKNNFNQIKKIDSNPNLGLQASLVTFSVIAIGSVGIFNPTEALAASNRVYENNDQLQINEIHETLPSQPFETALKEPKYKIDRNVAPKDVNQNEITRSIGRVPISQKLSRKIMQNPDLSKYFIKLEYQQKYDHKDIGNFSDQVHVYSLGRDRGLNNYLKQTNQTLGDVNIYFVINKKQVHPTQIEYALDSNGNAYLKVKVFKGSRNGDWFRGVTGTQRSQYIAAYIGPKYPQFKRIYNDNKNKSLKFTPKAMKDSADQSYQTIPQDGQIPQTQVPGFVYTKPEEYYPTPSSVGSQE